MTNLLAAIPPAPPVTSLRARPVLRTTRHAASGRDVLDNAWGRGDLATAWTRFRTGQAARKLAQVRGLKADPDQVDNVINEVRYRYDLVAAEDVAPWLARHGLTPADLHQHGEREFWRQQALAESIAPETAPREANPSDWDAFAADLVLAGDFTGLARSLAVRLLVDESAGDDPALAGELPPPSANELAQLGRDATWWTEHMCRERRYAAACAALCTDAARNHWLRARGSGLTRVELAWLDFDSVEAMREAQQCVATDGQTLEEVASTALLQVEHCTALIDELAPELRATVSQRPAGQTIPLVDERHRLFRLLELRAKQPPSIADPAVRAKVDAGIIAAHFEPRLVTEVQWLLGAAAA